jgi:sarcosine oxidase / L-pipecolate oxidase
MSSVNGSSTKIPESIIIVGLGVFGLSTALAISQRPQWSQTRITVIEASPALPNPGGASTDHSRIVRPDYGNLAYAELALEAQKLWRNTSDGWGAHGRYHQSGFAMIAHAGSGEYVQKSLDNVQKLAPNFPDVGTIEVLTSPEQVKKVTGGVLAGDWGYVNWGSGWADATASMKYALSRLDTSRVHMETGEVTKLIEDSKDRSLIVGVQLITGECLHADLVVLATGAWTNKLIDLRGRIDATGQPLAYLDLLDSEQGLLKNKPIVMNMSTGVYIIPQNEKLLKIGRHSYGYSNPRRPNLEGGESVAVSLPPEDRVDLPEEAQEEFCRALRASFPGIEKREFSGRRVCWYTDTSGLPSTSTIRILISFQTAHKFLDRFSSLVLGPFPCYWRQRACIQVPSSHWR